MSAPANQPPDSHAGAGGYERRDISPRPIILATLASVAVVALVFVAMWVVTGVFSDRVARQSPAANPLAAQFGRKQPPAPRLQPQPIKDLQEFLAAEDKVLQGYAWVDRQAGLLRLPIERAIELTAQRGLPARQSAGTGENP